MKAITPITGGDRCVLILLTDAPWRWTRQMRVWTRDAELVVCTRWLGSGGAQEVLNDPTGYNDLLGIVADVAGLSMLAEYDRSEDTPDAPVVLAIPRSGWDDAQQQVYRETGDDVRACGWSHVMDQIEPRAGDVIAYLAGWWAGRASMNEPAPDRSSNDHPGAP